MVEPPHTNSQVPARAYPRDPGKGIIVLENELLRFEIDPERGGRVSSFIDKRDGVERVRPSRIQGLAFDQFYEMNATLYSGKWNIDMALPYESEILEPGGERAAVRVGVASLPGEGNVYNENYADLYLERTFTLGPASPVLEIAVRLHNRSCEGRRPAYWMRSGYVMGGGLENQRYYRPSQRGIQVGRPDDPAADQIVMDPAYGWTASIDAATRDGVVWLMDASRLMMFYNCLTAVSGRHIDDLPNQHGVDALWLWDNAGNTSVTVEWYYHKACLPAGGVWETPIRMVSCKGLDAVAHACELFIADLKLPRSGNVGAVGMDLVQSCRAVHNLHISGELIDLDAKSQKTTLGTIRTGELALEPISLSFPQEVSLPARAVLRFRITGRTSEGEPIRERFEYLHRPTERAAPRVVASTLVRSAPERAAPEPEGEELSYRIPPPQLQLSYQPGARGLRPDGQGRVLFLQGLAFERWGLLESLEEMEATVREVEFFKRRVTTGIRYFPTTLGEALRHDLIILAAVDAHAIGYEGCMILHDFVHNGGGLLVLGGLYGWGGGRFAEMGLDSLLPLSVRTTFDLKRGDSGNLTLNEKLADEVFGAGLGEPPGPADWGVVYWFHQVKARRRAKVLLKLGKHPILAVNAPEQGRIACISGTTLGPSRPDDRPYWQQDAWRRTLKLVLRWLVREED